MTYRNDAPRQITILGATGSIGQSTLDVVARHPDRFSVFAATACRRVDELARICHRFSPRYAVIADETLAPRLRELLGAQSRTEVLGGTDSLCAVAADPEADTVVAAIVGAAGLPPTLAAVQAGKRVLLANKEALVMTGALFMQAVADSGAELLPIDSEHNAIFQCLPVGQSRNLDAAGVRRILLTASGGPFRENSLADLGRVTPAQACAHPNWSMGRKISVDSASLMNKGLELIEACWLFNTEPSRVEVHIHPESIVHSMVEYLDGSVIAQLGSPDMRTPIANGLAWPERIDSGVKPLDLFTLGNFRFERPDLERFPCLALAAEAFRAGGTAPAALNAANEEAVGAFLDGRLRFIDIPGIIDQVLAAVPVRPATTIEAIMTVDREARYEAQLRVRQASPV
jgi:1-deoxy-D-xylulose-5-phosphate reductoisomerase